MNVTELSSLLAASPGAPPRPRSELGKDEFMQLLVTQLRHQDPMNPANAQEFAAQLAQFSSLEQLVNLGKAIESQNEIATASIQAQNNTSALGVIGKTVVAQTDYMVVSDTGTNVDFVSPVGGNATLRIYSEDGQELQAIALGRVARGRTQKDVSDLLQSLPPGNYRHRVEVVQDNGATEAATTFIRTPINGVQYTSSGPMLVSGGLLIPLNAVVEVTATTTEATP